MLWHASCIFTNKDNKQHDPLEEKLWLQILKLHVTGTIIIFISNSRAILMDLRRLN